MHVGQSIGPFVIEKELGSGAMGSVYRARLREDGKEDRIVALKVIAFGLSSNKTALDRFEREAKILKQLKHPNIVRFLATGRYKGTPFFAMEFADGRSLDKIMAERTVGVVNRAPFTWEEVIEMGKPLCAALQHAHDKGIIHRDLKPSNLMLTREGMLKLTDFGIAKDLDVTALTGANNTIGTAAYMSPEQCKGERNLTGKSDLYSLGVVFYELLTGRKPFNAESSVDMFLMHVQSTFPRPAQLNPDIPVWLDTLVCQMLEKKPEHRPRDAAMVEQVLDEISEKVASQVSAGADLANARAVDTRGLGEDDRRAARAIRAGGKKKKLRKCKQPVYSKGWFVALACMLVIAAISWVIYEFAIAPPSVASLLASVESAKEPRAQQEAAARYLKYYGDRDDEKTRWVKGLERDLKVKEREHVLLNRVKIERLRSRAEDEDDPEAYAKTMNALVAENAGDLVGARAIWVDLANRFANDSSPDKAMWGLHAQKKLNDLSAAERHFADLTKQLDDQFRLEDKDVRFEDDLDQRMMEAVRFEGLKDFNRAYARWSQIAESLKGSDERRAVFVLTQGRARALESVKADPKDASERAKLIAERIAAARPLLVDGLPVKRKAGRSALRDIRDLYSGESGEIGQLVEQAKKLLADNPPA